MNKYITIIGLLVISALGAANAVVKLNSIFLFWISITPLLLVIRSLRLKPSTGYGALWGICFQLFFALLSEKPPGITLFNVIFISSAAALYTALGVYIVRRFHIGAVALGFGWLAAIPIIRMVGLNFGFFPLTFSADTLILVAVEYLGYSFIAFLIVYLNALLITIAGSIIYKFYRLIKFGIYHSRQLFVQLKNVILASSFISHTIRPRAPPYRYYLKSSCRSAYSLGNGSIITEK